MDPQPAPGSWLHQHRWALGLWAIALVAGVALRWWILSTVLGDADLDEATVGIHATRFGDGELNAFFPRQGYGGTIETALVAGVFKVFGASIVALKVVPMVLALIAAALTRQIAIELDLRRTAQWCVPILVWCGPAYAVLFSTKERGFYGVALVLAAAFPLLALRLAAVPTTQDALLLGACIGLGWWQTPLTFAVAVPAVVWLLCVRPDAMAKLWWGIPAALAAALPWFWWNATNGWTSMDGVTSFGTTWWDRFFDWLVRLQVVVGVETPFDASRRIFDTRWAGLVVLGALVVAASIRTNWEAPWFLATMVVGYGAIYAVNGLAAGVGEDPRYTYLMVPIVAVCIGAVLPDPPTDAGRFAVGIGVTALAVATTAWGLAGAHNAALVERPNYFLSSPGLERVADLLEDRGVEAAFTDLSGTQISFLTDERVVASSFMVPRFDEYEFLAAAAEQSTYVLDESMLDNVERVRSYATSQGIEFEEVAIGRWRVFFLEEKVLPSDARLRVFAGVAN